MNDLYQNAVDSLKIGIEFFLKEKNYSTRKHAILTLFHSIELLLKDYLYQTNPILIYKNIDVKITDDAITVGIRDILVRLENLGIGLPKVQQATIEKIQKRRNRIEHHRYDHKEEDEVIIAESLQFILFFVDMVLKRKLDTDIDADSLREVQRIVFAHDELYGIASNRLEYWMKEQWPDWNEMEDNLPAEFDGTLDCPMCRQTFLVIGYQDKPFCFHCNTSIDAEQCEECADVHLVSTGCLSCRPYVVY